MGAAAVLTILRNGETLKTHTLEGEAVLGRAEGCVIRLEDRAVSRQHAVFRPTSDGVQVEKKSEFAPIIVNGAECTKAVLKEGDVVSIGPYLMRVSLPKAAAAPEPKPAKSGAASPKEEKRSGTAELHAVSAPLESSEPAEAAEPLQALELTGSMVQAVEEIRAEEAPAQDAIPQFEPSMNMNLEDAQQVLGEPGEQGDANPSLEQMAQGADFGGGDAFGGAGVAMEAPEEIEEAVADDARTRLLPANKLYVRLVFQPGSANVEEFEITQDEISIGRGKDCDVILNDKKSSRKHVIIRRSGNSFILKDLGSANGTYVNGARAGEQEIFGEDVIQIGDTQFQFMAASADYAQKQQDFMPVPQEEEPAPMDQGGEMPMYPSDSMGQQSGAPVGIEGMGDPALGGVPGITGIPGGAASHDGSLIGKFKAMPKRQQYIYAAAVVMALFTLADILEEPAPAPKKEKTAVTAPSGAAAPSGPATFESLSAEQKAAVEQHYNMGFSKFRDRDYDSAIYEINQIFNFIPDYKDAREILRYAQEGKRKMEALAEEKLKKEKEAELKARIASLVDEARVLMTEKKYDLAKEKFGEILTLDPDNQQVTAWKKEIEEFEEAERLKAQEKQVQEEINRRAWEIYNEGMAAKKAGHCHTAIEVFGKVGDIGASDPKPLALAKKASGACRHSIKSRRDPVLAEAKQAEDAGETSKAFNLYKEATKIDPPHPTGYAGMSRIRGILHVRAKGLYTEAVLAESYSDFATAKKKYQECLQVAPEDDIYHQRAKRKLAHYFQKEEMPL